MAIWKFHPLGGLPLKNWLKLLVAFDIIVVSILLHLVVLRMADIGKLMSELEVSSRFSSSSDAFSHRIKVHMKNLIIIAAFLIIYILLDVWMWILTTKGNELKFKIWLLVKITFEICYGIGFIVEVILGYYPLVFIIILIVKFLFNCYFLWVVVTYLAELKIKKEQEDQEERTTAPIDPLDASSEIL